MTDHCCISLQLIKCTVLCKESYDTKNKFRDGSIRWKEICTGVLLKMNVIERQRAKKINRSNSDNFFHARTSIGVSNSNYYRVRKMNLLK